MTFYFFLPSCFKIILPCFSIIISSEGSMSASILYSTYKWDTLHVHNKIAFTGIQERLPNYPLNLGRGISWIRNSVKTYLTSRSSITPWQYNTRQAYLHTLYPRTCFINISSRTTFQWRFNNQIERKEEDEYLWNNKKSHCIWFDHLITRIPHSGVCLFYSVGSQGYQPTGVKATYVTEGYDVENFLKKINKCSTPLLPLQDTMCTKNM